MWKLTHMWTYAEKKIALNVCEVKHGIPFLRLARFGFVASPTPKDLAGILNANALYSVATGIFQVFGGVFLIFSVGNADLMVLLPFEHIPLQFGALGVQCISGFQRHLDRN
jgi:hypothetical protein